MQTIIPPGVAPPTGNQAPTDPRVPPAQFGPPVPQEPWSDGPGQPPIRPRPAAPPKPRSPLGRLVLSVMLLSLGIVGLFDLASVPVPVSAYFAVPLAVTGAGLVLGARYGNAKWLIAVGIVLSVGLAITVAAEGWNVTSPRRSVTWEPVGIEQLDRTYEVNIGNAVLDLSDVDFTGRTESVDVHVSVGDLQIILPPNVDVQIRANVNIGNAIVFGQGWSGINQSQRNFTDFGEDGPGGGDLTIRASVDVGDLGVRR